MRRIADISSHGWPSCVSPTPSCRYRLALASADVDDPALERRKLRAHLRQSRGPPKRPAPSSVRLPWRCSSHRGVCRSQAGPAMRRVGQLSSLSPVSCASLESRIQARHAHFGMAGGRRAGDETHSIDVGGCERRLWYSSRQRSCAGGPTQIGDSAPSSAGMRRVPNGAGPVPRAG